MAISHDFLNKIRAMKDGGLNLTFEDLIKGMERSFNAILPSGMGEVEEGDVLKWTEEACRKRIAENEKAWNAWKEATYCQQSSALDLMLRDNMEAPVQCQNPNP